MSKADTKLTPQPVRINRRQALASGGAALSVGAAAFVPAVAASAALPGAADHALGELWTRYMEIWKEIGVLGCVRSRSPEGDEAERQQLALWDRADEIEAQITDLPAASYVGIAIKMHLHLLNGGFSEHIDDTSDDGGGYRLLINVCLDAERLAGRAVS